MHLQKIRKKQMFKQIKCARVDPNKTPQSVNMSPVQFHCDKLEIKRDCYAFNADQERIIFKRKKLKERNSLQKEVEQSKDGSFA